MHTLRVPAGEGLALPSGHGSGYASGEIIIENVGADLVSALAAWRGAKAGIRQTGPTPGRPLQ